MSPAIGQQPLQGIRVLDFSTLLPGPMCSLLLAEAGADVIKVEKPDGGDTMRSYQPRFGDEAVNFVMLNRGKRSIAIDLTTADGIERALQLVREADVLIEQFRPGAMRRLGLDYERLHEIKPDLIYCSITGYGQSGPLAQRAAHDLNFAADVGLLSQTADASGHPQLPHTLIGDIAGGTYPAVINILLALRRRDAGGGGCHLDIAMADSLFTTMYWGLGNGFAAGQWPRPAADLLTGGSPRYRIYRTRDDRFLAAAPLEDKFWGVFLDVLGAPELFDDAGDPEAVCRAVTAIVRSRDAADWEARFAGRDACVNLVRSLGEAVVHPQFVSRGLFGRRTVDAAGRTIPALPVPIADRFRGRADLPLSYPLLDDARRPVGFGAPGASA